MKKFRIISYLVELTIVSLLWPFMGGTIKNWWIVLIVTLLYHFATWERSTQAINFPSKEKESELDLLNGGLWANILVLGVGVTGVVFSVVEHNWKVVIVWLLLVLYCCYRLSKYFNKNN